MRSGGAQCVRAKQAHPALRTQGLQKTSRLWTVIPDCMIDSSRLLAAFQPFTLFSSHVGSAAFGNRTLNSHIIIELTEQSVPKQRRFESIADVISLVWAKKVQTFGRPRPFHNRGFGTLV